MRLPIYVVLTLNFNNKKGERGAVLYTELGTLTYMITLREGQVLK